MSSDMCSSPVCAKGSTVHSVVSMIRSSDDNAVSVCSGSLRVVSAMPQSSRPRAMPVRCLLVNTCSGPAPTAEALPGSSSQRTPESASKRTAPWPLPSLAWNCSSASR